MWPEKQPLLYWIQVNLTIITLNGFWRGELEQLSQEKVWDPRSNYKYKELVSLRARSVLHHDMTLHGHAGGAVSTYYCAEIRQFLILCHKALAMYQKTKQLWQNIQQSYISTVNQMIAVSVLKSSNKIEITS